MFVKWNTRSNKSEWFRLKCRTLCKAEGRATARADEKRHFRQTKFKVFCLSHSTHKMQLHNFSKLHSMSILFDSFRITYTLTITALKSLIIFIFFFFVHLVFKVFARKSRKFVEQKKKRAHLHKICGKMRKI